MQFSVHLLSFEDDVLVVYARSVSHAHTIRHGKDYKVFWLKYFQWLSSVFWHWLCSALQNNKISSITVAPLTLSWFSIEKFPTVVASLMHHGSCLCVWLGQKLHSNTITHKHNLCMGALSWCIHQRRNDRATVSMRIKRVHDENTERKKHKREREKGSNRKKCVLAMKS